MMQSTLSSNIAVCGKIDRREERNQNICFVTMIEKPTANIFEPLVNGITWSLHKFDTRDNFKNEPDFP